MRGFRSLGRLNLVSMNDYDDGDLLFFSPNEDGSNMRAGWIRGGAFDLFACQTNAVMGLCPTDYMFVATAIGEHAFAREPAPEEVS